MLEAVAHANGRLPADSVAKEYRVVVSDVHDQ